MTPLTHVELVHLEGQVERWVRFGHEMSERFVDRRRRVLSFAPGAVFAFVRWASNGYGTAVSRIDVLRAVAAGEPQCRRLPGLACFLASRFAFPGAGPNAALPNWCTLTSCSEAAILPRWSNRNFSWTRYGRRSDNCAE